MSSGISTRELAEQRREMVEEQIRDRGVRDPRVLDAMLRVPRHEFVPEDFVPGAYADQPLPIGEGQTISQPFMVAAMTQALELQGHERVLEIGTGSGYQAAVLAVLAREVYSVENLASLAAVAQARLVRLGYDNVQVHSGDGTLGWPAAAPYDAIMVTAAAPHVPSPLVEQLAEGGRMVIPVGSAAEQELLRVRKTEGRITSETLHYCRFVPLLGRHGWPGAHSG
ncbi:MAG TPA: protein-L-isoaspartate(D-aspartate) O-methyltransferase [Candidatus Acidoferrales bacterium]|jgi:protein-L-isoaspartate(D-aspartate) O-methyltransferase|nr:protein-L-isoaspartate(D-aspartate) O-methyltransferase [Candidatus Acidoferrales bacterium]